MPERICDQQLTPVVMGPRLRRDDVFATGVTRHEFRFLRRPEATARRGAEISSPKNARRRRCAPCSTATRPTTRNCGRASPRWAFSASRFRKSSAAQARDILSSASIAEEMGRALAPVPFSSTVYLAAEALMLAGSDAQKQKWLPKIASGEAIGTLALFEGKGNPSPQAIKLTASGGTLTGVKKPVPDGAIADFAIVAARTGSQRPRNRYLAVHRRHERRGRRSQGADQCRSVARPGRDHVQEMQGRAARPRQ